MVKHIQKIRRQFADEFFEFDHFVGLALKGLTMQTKYCLIVRISSLSVA